MKSKKGISTEVFTIAAFFVLFAVICLTFQAFKPSFLSPDSVVTMLKTGARTAIAALGLTFVIVVNHSDISFYMSCCFSSMLMAWLIAKGVHPVPAVLAGLVAGVIWGAFSGLAVGKFKLPDIISTIAIGSIAFGGAYIFSDGAFIYDNFHTSGIIALSEGRILGVNTSVWIMIVLYVIAYVVLERSAGAASSTPPAPTKRRPSSPASRSTASSPSPSSSPALWPRWPPSSPTPPRARAT